MDEEEAEPELGGCLVGRRWSPGSSARHHRGLLIGAPCSIPANSCNHHHHRHQQDNDGRHPNYAAVQRADHLDVSSNLRPHSSLNGTSRQSRAGLWLPSLVMVVLLVLLEPLAAQSSWQHNDLANGHNSSLDSMAMMMMVADYDNDNINKLVLQAPDDDQISRKRSVSAPSNTSTWSLLVAALVQFEPTTGEFAQVNWPNVLLALVLVLLMVTTAVGNLFVIVAILIERNLRIVGNYLVLSLAIADLLVALLVMPLAGIYQILHQWTLGLLLCDIWTSADVFCCTASILHLLAIALDRYWAVTRVNYIRCQRNERRILFMILFVWLTSSVISLAPVLGWKDDKFEERLFEGKECLLSQDIGYQLFATSTTFYFPVTLTLIFYWKIYQVARKRIRRKLGNRVKVALQQPSSTSSGSSPPAKHQSSKTTASKANKQQQQHPNQLQSVPATVAPPLKSMVVDYRPGANNFSTSIQSDDRANAAGRSLECACLCHAPVGQPEGDNQDTARGDGSTDSGRKTDSDLQLAAVRRKPEEEANQMEKDERGPEEEPQGDGTRKFSASEPNNCIAPVQCSKCKRINQMLYLQHSCRMSCFKHRSSSASRNLGSSLASCSRASSLAACAGLIRANNATDEIISASQQHQDRETLMASPEGSLDDSSLIQMSAKSFAPSKEAQQTGDKSQNGSESNLNGLIECDCCVCDCCDVNLNGADEMGADYEGAERHIEELNVAPGSKNDHRLLSESKQMANPGEANRAITFHDPDNEKVPKQEAFSEPPGMQENGLVIACSESSERAAGSANRLPNGNSSSRLIAMCWRRLVAVQQGARRFGRRQNSLQPTLESSATTCDDDDDQTTRENTTSKRQLLISASGKNNCDHTTILMSAHSAPNDACKLCGCVAKQTDGRPSLERQQTDSKVSADIAFDLRVSLHNQPNTTQVSSDPSQLELGRSTAKTSERFEKTGSQGEPTSVAAVAVSSAQIAVSTTVRQVDAASGKVRVMTATPTKNPLANHNQSVSLQNHAANMESVESKRERKAFKTLAIITGVFVMCWLPFFIIALARPLLDFQPSEWFQGFTLWLGYFNSMLNPIIYTIFSPDFRKAFKRLLCNSDSHSSPSHSSSRKSPTASNRSRGGPPMDRSQMVTTSDNQHSPIGKTGKRGFINENCTTSRNWNGNEQVKRSKNAVVHDFV